MSPPTDPKDLDKKIEEIQKKKTWYEENGTSKLEEQIAEIRKQHEQEDQEEVKEQVYHDDEDKRGGRGGRGRGGR